MDGVCRQAEEDLAEHSVCRHVKACTRLVVEGTVSVGRPRRTWQNTLSVDMRLLKSDPRDVHDRKKWSAIRRTPQGLQHHLETGRKKLNLNRITHPDSPTVPPEQNHSP